MKQYYTLLFFLITCVCFSQISDFNHVNFTKADNIVKLYKGENLNNLPLLTYKLTNKLPSEVEKFRAIYKWVCENIKGDYKLYSKISRKRKKLKNDSLQYLKWNNEYKKVAFKKLLKQKKTMCTGYAYIIKEMAFLAGIESKIIDGYGRTVNSNTHDLEILNHSWNAVKLNNKWYLCDATWSSGYMNEQNTFIEDYNNGYFLANPELFAKNHFPIYEKWFLSNKIPSSTFTNSPLIYDIIFKYKIIPVYPSLMNFETKKNEEIEFKFKSTKEISTKKMSLVLFRNSNQTFFKIYDIKNIDGLLSFKSKLNLKGLYDIHLKIGNDILATYTVKVTE